MLPFCQETGSGKTAAVNSEEQDEPVARARQGRTEVLTTPHKVGRRNNQNSPEHIHGNISRWHLVRPAPFLSAAKKARIRCHRADYRWWWELLPRRRGCLRLSLVRLDVSRYGAVFVHWI